MEGEEEITATPRSPAESGVGVIWNLDAENLIRNTKNDDRRSHTNMFGCYLKNQVHLTQRRER